MTHRRINTNTHPHIIVSTQTDRHSYASTKNNIDNITNPHFHVLRQTQIDEVTTHKPIKSLIHTDTYPDIPPNITRQRYLRFDTETTTWSRHRHLHVSVHIILSTPATREPAIQAPIKHVGDTGEKESNTKTTTWSQIPHLPVSIHICSHINTCYP